ncbi:MAG TPA: zinc ABC transporter substrate-binding protein [Syntrophales bacterium]|nr:zinc ABC transporter substrate-binding protein [Syntrophales bacterium]
MANGPKKLRVVATIFPLFDFARAVGGDKADVSLLLPPGIEPHAFEPRPTDFRRIQDSDIFLFTGKFMEPWVAGLLKGIDAKSLSIVDTSKGIPLLEMVNHDGEEYPHPGSSGTPDPHIWLDFMDAARMIDTITAEFIAKDPGNGNLYARNSHEYKKKLEELDKKYQTGLSHCASKVIVHTGHFAFGYLARRYGLTYVSAYQGFSPDAEPTPRRLVEITRTVRKYGVKYIYYEELVAPKVADVIAKETGCSLLLLNAAHNVTSDEMQKGTTFISIMEKDLDNLKVGLQCR